MRAFVFGLVGVAVLVPVVACHQMNRPAPVIQSAPRTACLTDVECSSGGHCVKGPDDIQGECVGGATAGDSADAGNSGSRPTAPPMVTASPSDIHL